jgi:antitoxin (DNA-binding transcriptional repressor) of toxin-antitoxin stability system
MIQIPAKQAVTEFDKLLNEVAQGQDVVIIGSDGLAFKLTALPRTPQPILGSARGLVHIGPDFDQPIEGFEEYMQRPA